MMTPVCVGGRASVVVTGEDHDDSCLCWSSPRCVPGREDRPGASCLGGRNLDSLSVLSTNTTTTDQRDESGEMLPPHLPQPHLSIPSLHHHMSSQLHQMDGMYHCKFFSGWVGFSEVSFFKTFLDGRLQVFQTKLLKSFAK